MERIISFLVKSEVKNLSLEKNDCFMWLNAEELLRVSGAIIDCYLKEAFKALYRKVYRTSDTRSF